MEDLFDFPALWVVQPGHLPASRARYQILSGKKDKDLIANAADVERRGWVPEFLKHVPDATVLAVDTPAGEALMTLTMRHTQWTTEFRDPDGKIFGTIRMGDTRRQYDILDEEGQPVAKVVGDLGLKTFSISDTSKSKVAVVRKTSAGLFKELMTQNDHYKVEFIGPVPAPPLRTFITMVPVIIDLILYERV